MRDPFSDLPDAGNPFADLPDVQQAPDPTLKPQGVAPQGRFAGGNVAVFSDEKTPFQGVKPEIIEAYNALARDPRSTADDLLRFSEANGVGRADDWVAGPGGKAVPFRSVVEDYVSKRNAGTIQVGEGAANVEGAAAPVQLDPATQAAAQDIGTSDGTLDWLGDLLSRGGAGLEAGGKQFGAALHDFNQFRLPWQSEDDFLVNLGRSKLTQGDLRGEAAQLSALAGTPIAGEVGGDQALDALGSADLGTLGRFFLEQGVQSVPAMAEMVANPFAFVMSNTGSIAQQRARSNGNPDASLGDVGVALPFGIASAAAERAGIESIFGGHGGNVAARIGKAALGEGATESVQTGIEDTGGTIGTDAGANLSQMFKDMAVAGLAGAGIGGAIRGPIEGAKAVPGALRAANDAQQGVRLAAEALALPAPEARVPRAPMEPGPEPMIAPRTAEGRAPQRQAAPQAQADPFADLPSESAAAPEGQPVEPQPVVTGGSPQGGDGGLGQPVAQSEPQRPAPQTAQASEPQPLQDGEKYVRTPAGNKVRTRLEVVDASTLNKAEGRLQNRDRTRETTTLQVQDIISKFDPELLGDDPSSDRGAPIIGQDHTVLSGNGRMLALNKIFDQYPEKADAYRKFIEAQGHSTEGMERPVLIRRVTQDMTPEEARQFVVESNKDDKLAMSASEKARSDADYITPEMLARYAGGDLNSGANTGFVEAFTKQLTAGELGGMIDANRRLTEDGKARIENAVVAVAYGKPHLLEKMMESADNEIRSITGSLAAVAPAWAKMREAAKSGEIDGKYDVTDDLLAAAERVAEAKRRGEKPADILTQIDAFNQLPPAEEEFIRAFYNAEMTRAASKKAVTEFLADYAATAAAQKQTTDMFGVTTSGKEPVDILKELLRQRDNPQGASMFDAIDKESADGPEYDRNDRGGDGASSRLGGGGEIEAPAGIAHASRTRAGSGADSAADAGRAASRGPVRRAQGASGAASRDAGSPDGRTRAGVEPDAPGRDEPNRQQRHRHSGGVEDALEALDTEEAEAGSYGPAKVAAKGAYRPSFEAASFTDRASIFNSAAEALGLDPDKFRLLPSKRQVALLRRAIWERFGIRVDVDPTLQERFAIDQMLDAFQNVQGMAHVLGLPSKAMSFDGKLGLKLLKKGNFLGVFYSGENVIGLPKRSNSFAHEWGHALDYFLLEQTGGDGRGLSGAVRQQGSKLENAELPTDIRSAFVNLLNAMFFDKAGLAAKALELEARIAAAKGPKTKAQLQAQLDRLKAGGSQMKGARSDFYKGAQDFDGPGGDYWTSPTEMLARSFEAFVSYKVEAAGLTTEFLGKGDAGYLDGAGERFEKTFPKGDERAEIFAAYEHLFAHIGDQALLAEGEAAARPAGSKSKLTDLDRTPSVPKERGIVRRELREIRNHFIQVAKEREGRADDPKSVGEWLGDANGAMLMSMTGAMRMIQRRSGSPSLQRLIDLLTKQDGRGDRTVRRTFHEDVHLHSKRALNRLGNILKANGLLKGRTAEDDRMLRDLLIGEDRADAPPNFVKAAAAIRQLLDNEFYENQRAGIDLGYVRSGYLQRALDLPRVWEDQAGFTRDAAKVYEIVFDNEFGSPESLVGNEEAFPRFLKLARSLAKNGHDIDIEPVRKILKAMRSVDQAMTKAKAKGEDFGHLEGKLDELQGQLVEAVGELWDQVRPAFAKERAEAWLAKVNLTAGEEHNAAAPDSKYTKNRTLPPEADKIMEKFYLQDPVEAVTNYINQSARRTAYAKRFGSDGKRRKALFERMAAEGVSPTDQRNVEEMLDIATGRKRSTLNSGFQRALGWVNAFGTMALLPRAWISSLAEPFTAGLVTGDARDGFKLMGQMLGGALGSPSGKWRYEMARAMGIVSDIGADGIMEARYGQTFGDQTRADRAVATMFRRTLLTPLTRAQKTHGVGLGHAFLDSLALKVTQDSGTARDHAIALLRELGVRDPEAFAAQLLEIGRPTVEDLDTPFGEDYSTAQLRFSDMVIQNPGAMDRPELSQNPVGRIIYSITGFSYGYWRNIIKRNAILVGQIAGRAGTAQAALYASKMLAGAALAYLIGTTVSTLREYLLNRRRWRELEQDGTLYPTMAALGFTRVFSLGAADPAIQAYSGLKYQRDLGTALLGAKVGYFADAASKPIQLTLNNSRKTNTAEYRAVQGATSLVTPIIAFGMASAPGGPLVDGAAGLGISYVTAPAFRDDVATMVVGPKHGSKGADGTKTKSGPTAYDQFLDETFGEVKRKGSKDN